MSTPSWPACSCSLERSCSSRYAPFTYNIYLGLHVLAAVTWSWGHTLTTLGIVFERRSEGETLGALGRMGA